MILITYGTRPEWIKVKPLINQMIKENISFKTLFTGQHTSIAPNCADYTYAMSDITNNRLNNIIFNCLNLPDEFFNGITHVLVQGDTSSALGLALNAYNRKIKIIHLEAGLRTDDFKNPYPEEANRQLISRISNINLCPTLQNLNNLKNENVMGESHVVGNTVLDNLIEYKDKTSYDDIVLVTLHRRENHNIIQEWFKKINELAIEYPNIKFILPLHPNPNIKQYKNLLKNINVIKPLSHDKLLNILIKCKLVITDSGGLQEECSFLNKKCLVCREITERTESIGKSTFIVNSPAKLKNIFKDHILNFEINYKSPFGDGYSSKKICNILNRELHQS